MYRAINNAVHLHTTHASQDYSIHENMWDAQNTQAYTNQESYHKYRGQYVGFRSWVGMQNIQQVRECALVMLKRRKILTSTWVK